jgi:hypothetical protein
MKEQSTRLAFPSNLVVAVGMMSLLAIILVQAFSTSSFANASNRDEFPGRRQGGGTHWVAPSPANFE